jgi:hypothetical protein
VLQRARDLHGVGEQRRPLGVIQKRLRRRRAGGLDKPAPSMGLDAIGDVAGILLVNR